MPEPQTKEKKLFQSKEEFARFMAGEIEFPVAAESTGVTGLPAERQQPETPRLEQFQEGTPDVTQPVAAVAGFASGAIPFLDKIPGLDERFQAARDSFPKTFMAGEVAGTFIPAGASLKAAKIALKPFIAKVLPLIKSNRLSVEILKQSGIAVSEGVLADLFFSAVSLESPDAKSMAAFAAIDAALPGLGKIFKKIRNGLKLTPAEREIIPESVENELRSKMKSKPFSQKEVDTLVEGKKPAEKPAVAAEKVAPEPSTKPITGEPLKQQKFKGIPNVLVEKAQKASKEDFVTSTFEIPLNELKTGVTQEQILSKSTGRIVKSRTPDAPIVIGFKDGEVVILDGLHRYFEKLNSGVKTIKARFAFNEGEEGLYDLISRTTKRVKEGGEPSGIRKTKEAAKETKAQVGAKVPGAAGQPAAPPLTRKQAIGETKIEKFEKESQPVIKETVEQFGKDIREQRRGQRPISLTNSQAKKQKDFVLRAVNGQIKPGTAVNAEELEALGGALNFLSLKVKANPKLMTDPAFAAKYKNLTKAFFGGATEAGRSLRQLRENRSMIDFEALDAIRTSTGDVDLARDLDKFIRKNKPIPPNFIDKFIEFQRNMKLWSASAPIRSVVGNMTMQMFKQAEIPLSAVINRALAAITGIKQDRFARELAADWVGMKSGIGEGFEAAGQILKENNKFLSENLFLRREFGRNIQAIKGQKGRIIRFGQNIQGAIDSVFRIPATRGEARRRAVRQAMQDGLEGSQFHKKVEELTNKFLNDPKIFKEIQEVAAEQTFQKELGKIGKAINNLRQTNRGIVQVVVPFFNTAANLWKEFVKRTPLGIIRPTFWSKDVRNAVLRKEIGGFSDSLARMVTGTTFFATTNLVVSKILQGQIHGKGTKDKNLRNQMFGNGWQPYSIEVDGQFVSYLGFEPVSSFLGASSDWNAGFRDGGTKKAIEQSMSGIVATFAENPFLQGVVDVADLVRGRKDITEFFAGMAAGSVIPSLVRQTITAINPELKRRPDTTADKISNAFLFGKVEDRFNPLGMKAVRRGAVGNIFAVRVTKQRDDPVLNELNKLKLGLGSGVSYKGVRLTEKEKNKLNEIGGKAVYTAIFRMISNPSWKTLGTERKIRAIKRTKNRILDHQKALIFGRRGEKLTRVAAQE